jgi:hypothetical protein
MSPQRQFYGNTYQQGKYVVTLMSAAKILPSDLNINAKAPMSINATGSYAGLKELYQKYWQDILGSGVGLVDYYAQQKLASSYSHRKKHRADTGEYYPDWLTVAGSVFTLDISNQDAFDKLMHYQHVGLPCKIDLKDGVSAWRTTAYLPENGYGEILVQDWSSLPDKISSGVRKRGVADD